MQKIDHILVLFFFGYFISFSQVSDNNLFEIKGSVKCKKDYAPIQNVEISSNKGTYTRTNSYGKYSLLVSIGDILTFKSPQFRTKKHIIKAYNDINILLERNTVDHNSLIELQYSNVRSQNKTLKRWMSKQKHQIYLDSASLYKEKDIKKSIDFITQSIEQLGKRANKIELAASLTALGEVYQYHKQYDLAIMNYKDALKANKTTTTTLLLGNVYILNKDFKAAEQVLLPLLKLKSRVPFQNVQLNESLGDVYVGLGDINKSVAFYENGLGIAKKNQITTKITDLNSKIALAYAKDDRTLQAEGFFRNSLKLAQKEAPQRAIQEKEKIADFYNKKNRYVEEIQLRKKSLSELKNIAEPIVENNSALIDADTITSQRINYKIANAYIAQDKYEQAIPYLEKSIVEADSDDDLLVQKDATRKLSEVFEYTGNFTKALATYQAYVAVVDTLYIRKEQEISQAKRFSREISRYSGLEKEIEISKIKRNISLAEQKLVQESNKRQKWVIYSLIFGLVLMGLATFFFYRSNQQQKLANNLLALKSLRSQMNPHFIFNALNSVNTYIAKSDERKANRYLSDFSTLMRSVLENSEEDLISLTKEIELLELYVKLEHSRFSDKFDYEINIDEHLDVAGFQIPPMLLQPYIENAIWHGLRYKEEKGFLHISLNHKNKDVVEITIKDNGIGRKRSIQLKTQNQKKQKSKGMGNIKKRVAILNDMYKDKVDVKISDLADNGSGTLVRFTLKKINLNKIKSYKVT